MSDNSFLSCLTWLININVMTHTNCGVLKNHNYLLVIIVIAKSNREDYGQYD